MNPILLAIVVTAALAIVPTTQACAHNNALGQFVVPVGPVYIVHDDTTCSGCNPFWVFVESNEIDGLQAGGCSEFVEDDCWYECGPWDPPARPDTLIV